MIVDVPDPATAVVNRFYTVEFYQAVHELLAPDGVVVTGVSATADVRDRALANRTATLYHTLDRVFAEVVAVGDRFVYFFAGKEPGQVSADPLVLQRRYADRGVHARGFSEAYYFTLLQEAPLRRLNWVLRHHGRSPDAHRQPPRAPPLFPGSLIEQAAAARADELPPVAEAFFINSDLRPVGYYYTVVLWHTLTRREQARAFDIFLGARAGWLIPVVGAAVALQLGLRALPRRHRRRADAGFALRAAILTTGFSIMALQIAVLFSFQSIYGFVYEMVGLIVALFMAGLAMGAWLCHRRRGIGCRHVRPLLHPHVRRRCAERGRVPRRRCLLDPAGPGARPGDGVRLRRRADRRLRRRARGGRGRGSDPGRRSLLLPGGGLECHRALAHNVERGVVVVRTGRGGVA